MNPSDVYPHLRLSLDTIYPHLRIYSDFKSSENNRNTHREGEE